MQADIEAHYHWIDGVAAASLVPACERLMQPGKSLESAALDYTTPPSLGLPTFTQRLDAVLVHKVWGLADLRRRSWARSSSPSSGWPSRS